MVKIRLTQTGSTNRKTYRIVAIEEGKRRDGKAIEILGFYNPLIKPANLTVKRDRVDYWISQGAQPTETVSKLLKLTP
ncbi:30S ribosomal protein S16 [Candidatus Gottesmanbacteria bacterium RIFCSPLOWO2_01_FULL_48_11]|uniref:Small ribosomal subunit protein bS16 n=3 Tax=Candidatus Gottesmaniibacteriota TaxID=1752720 RepID=A0A0G1XPQ0_9BACT|nr:MAG: 30S ribosomal protein S16 [Candidatus Gottesmanbacteria bacterium GW2011_GWA2_47_9]KKU96310.1 MAG: 30S ribosomal protein S16 [Candidatus Gottesmanbacteria bacterium GW2011_GWA1_48_13]OGG28191.1 MAG: 30S ribosomal protein S16 [Candidatus Gottesmanbacteria bacterium RIFCSPLOWO2_01_FULL_48_11]